MQARATENEVGLLLLWSWCCVSHKRNLPQVRKTKSKCWRRSSASSCHSSSTLLFLRIEATSLITWCFSTPSIASTASLSLCNEGVSSPLPRRCCCGTSENHIEDVSRGTCQRDPFATNHQENEFKTLTNTGMTELRPAEEQSR